ncbi:MAG: response regulator transcription factor [Gammaproteobacteria bacterium]|nr:response regulator transcription factor [Gammaproteobacteria bacterium]
MTTTDKPTTRLLLLDDDEAFSNILTRTLNRHGYEVSTASSIQQACLLAEQNRFPYAIIDLCIGSESGLTMVEHLIKRDVNIRIIILTGYASIATAVEAIKLGAIHYLTKPADADEIINAFKQESGNPDIKPAQNPMSVKRVEWEHLQRVLQQHNGNISATARAIGMHRRTLQRKLQNRPVRK